ncbi:MAG: ribonuclease P protein component [Chitinophagaceae bacterium]|nr:MAG: ribonuclease P protein component [Chitinophagaceae bacterium]
MNSGKDSRHGLRGDARSSRLKYMKQYGLPKSQKLKNKSAIDAVFAGGQRFSVFPVLTWYRATPAEGRAAGIQAGFSCSKKHFKKAVDRNRVKRLMREAWRLQKAEIQDFAAQNGLRLELFLIYLDKTLPEYDTIFAAVGKSLRQLKKKHHEAAQ